MVTFRVLVFLSCLWPHLSCAMVLSVDPHRVRMTQLFPCATNLILNGYEPFPQAEGQGCVRN